MFKKIILIQVDSILGYPPTMALINELVNAATEVTVLTTVVNNQLIEVLPKSVIIQKVGKDYTYNTSPITKLKDLHRFALWRRYSSVGYVKHYN